MTGFIKRKEEHTFYFMEVNDMASYRKHGKGWQVRVSWYDDDGKRHYTSKGGFKTKVDAKSYALELEQRKMTNTLSKKSITFSEYFWEWFETYKQNKISDVTANLYRIIRNVLINAFGNKKMDKITRRDYQLFLNDYGKTHAKVTVKKVHSILKATVKSAIYDGVVIKDFTHNVELTWNDDKTYKVEYLNMSEINKLISVAKEKINRHYTSRYMILTAIYTGLRLSEIAALTWKDINFNWKTIEISKSWDYHRNTFKDTKNQSSKRIIRINDELLQLLSELKQNGNELVFLNQFKNIPTSNAVNKTLRKLLKEADITKKGYHFHSLRHTHVALLLYNGVDIYAISKRLGHSDLTTTTRKYAYMIDELKSKSDDHIEDVLDNLSKKNTPDFVEKNQKY